MVSLLVEHKGGNGPTSVGMGTGLTSNTDSGTAPAVLILGARNGASGHQHGEVVVMMGEEITKVVDGGMTSQWCSLYPFLVRTMAGPERTDHLTQLRDQPHIHHRAPPLLHLISQ